MGLFKQSKPRGFRHEYMFVDSRKDRLRAIECRVKGELGVSTDIPLAHDRLRGTFMNATNHVRRRRERRAAGGFIPGFGMLILLLLLLFAVWKILLSL